MKKASKIVLVLVIVCVALIAWAALTPSPVAGYVFSGGNWTPLSGGGSGATLGYTPNPVGLYTWTGSVWQPWSGSGGAPGGACGGDLGGTFPNCTVVGTNGQTLPVSAALASTNGSGQIVAAAAATSPIVVSATGGISCATCATTTSGGALTGTAPIAISSAGAVSWSPLDPTTVWYKDEFGVGGTGTATIGELGWGFTQATSATAANIAGASPNIGIVRVTTGAAAGDGGAISMNLGAAGGFGTLGAYSNVDQQWIIRMNQTVDSSFRVGYVIGSAASTVEGTDGVWLRYEKNSSSGGTTQVAGTVVGNGTTAVYTTPTNHGYHVGDSAVTTLCSNAGFNATANITAVTATTFSTLNATNASATTCTSKVADTTFKFETRKSSTSDSFDTGVTPNASNYYRIDITNVASGKVSLTLYDNTGAVVAGPTTFCPSSCTVTSSNVNTASAMVPFFIIFSATGGGGSAVAAQVDRWSFLATGLVR